MHHALAQIIYAGTIFTSAFLLFLIQPLIGKQILPWFGGSAAVWSVCLVFFQVVLLAGYAYADVVTRWLRPRTQVVLHIALLVVSLATLPIVAGSQWKPDGQEEPTLWILGLLLATIGLPYFLLSTTGPLAQSWVARAPWGKRVYRYFSLSNLASLLSLLCYPLWVEPNAAMAVQARGWSWAYAAFVLLCSGAAFYSLRLPPAAAPSQAALVAGTTALRAAPGWTEYLLWLALPGLASWLLLAITNHLTRDVAVIPFLWVLPLTVYLLSFVLTFESDRWYRRGLFLPLTAAALLLCAYGLTERLGTRLTGAIPLYTAGLFVICMALHGELARMRPGPQHLTRFYLMLSLGGALGGSLVGLLAPALLNNYYELGAGFVLVGLLAAVVWRGRRTAVAASLLLASLCATLLVQQILYDADGVRRRERNFYGTLATSDTDGPDPMREMFHGAVKHGSQYLGAARRHEATTYYGVTSGIGRVMALLPAQDRRLGMIGLGVGTLAAYTRPGDVLRVYEINPQVVELAHSEFSFLADAPAQVETVLGDARLALESERSQRLDVLAVDAFTGDSVPVHLLTVEALGVYLRHLRPGGIVAFHVTNRFLALAPVVEQIAAAHGLPALRIRDEAEDSDLRATDWVLVAADPKTLLQPGLQRWASPIAPMAGLKPWTDDFNNLFGVVK